MLLERPLRVRKIELFRPLDPKQLPAFHQSSFAVNCDVIYE